MPLKATKKQLQNFPGDVVLRVSAKEIEEYHNRKQDNQTVVELNLENVVTMTIISSTLEDTTSIVTKINKNTMEISKMIIQKIMDEYIKVKEIESIDGYEDDFETYIYNHEGHVELKLNMPVKRKNSGTNYNAQVIFRSNGGFDEILKSLPIISNRERFNRKVMKMIRLSGS